LPVSSAHNLIIGTPYIDIAGKTKIINLNTNDYSEVEYKARGWGGKNNHLVVGEVKNADGKLCYKIDGHWSEKLILTDVETGEAQEVWKISPYNEDWDHNYHFTHFSLQLNYLPDSLKDKIPPTDCRFRPDQRALENGDTESASKLKHLLEEA
jgi:hypothetical protein